MILLSNGKNNLIDNASGGLPNMSSTLSGWFQKLTFNRVTKKVVNFEVVETVESFDFQGVKQPMTPQQLAIKPEGQRGWKWETIHALPSLELDLDEIIYFKKTPYRVKEKMHYQEYGYIEYHIVEDYDGSIK